MILQDPFNTLFNGEREKLNKKEELDDSIEFALDEILHNMGPSKQTNL